MLLLLLLIAHLIVVLFIAVVFIAVLLTVLLLQWVAFLMLGWNECSGESGMVRIKGTRERSASALLGGGPIDGKTRDKTIDCFFT